MSTKERILTLRLLDKASAQPAFAAALGIVPPEPDDVLGPEEPP